MKPRTEWAFGPARDLPSLIRAGQYLRAEGLRYIYDALRRKGKRIGGFTNHCYSEPWPNAAGSFLVDHDGRPLMNYDFIRQALAPIGLSLRYDAATYGPQTGIRSELFLVSDAPAETRDLGWQWLARDRTGTVVADGAGRASIRPLEVKSLAVLSVTPDPAVGGPLLVELRLRSAAGSLLAERVHVFGPAGPAPLAGLLYNREPESPAPVAGPPIPPVKPVRRTAIAVTAGPSRADGDWEMLDITLKNSGRMTALFCEPHPMLAYRTDLFIANNNCFIPPGESRVVTIRGPRRAADGLTLRQTGWRISCWNADDVTIEPSADVLLSIGRRDKTCREFSGYFSAKAGPLAALRGNRPDAARFSYRLDANEAAQFRLRRRRRAGAVADPHRRPIGRSTDGGRNHPQWANGDPNAAERTGYPAYRSGTPGVPSHHQVPVARVRLASCQEHADHSREGRRLVYLGRPRSCSLLVTEFFAPTTSATKAAATIMFTELALVMICWGRLPIMHHREPGPSAGPLHEPP